MGGQCYAPPSLLDVCEVSGHKFSYLAAVDLCEESGHRSGDLALLLVAEVPLGRQVGQSGEFHLVHYGQISKGRL